MGLNDRAQKLWNSFDKLDHTGKRRFNCKGLRGRKVYIDAGGEDGMGSSWCEVRINKGIRRVLYMKSYKITKYNPKYSIELYAYQTALDAEISSRKDGSKEEKKRHNKVNANF